MVGKILLAKRVLLITLISILCFSTCSASNNLPVSNLSSHDLAIAVNSILSLAQRDYRCSTPTFKFVDENGKIFGAHVGGLNAYNPGNGLVMFIEFPTGKTKSISVSFDKTDRVKNNQVCFFIACILKTCGLTTNEATQLVNKMNKPIDANTRYGYILCHGQNRYYVLCESKESNMITLTLYATDSM